MRHCGLSRKVNIQYPTKCRGQSWFAARNCGLSRKVSVILNQAVPKVRGAASQQVSQEGPDGVT